MCAPGWVCAWVGQCGSSPGRALERDDALPGATFLGLALRVRGRYPERTGPTRCLLAGLAHAGAETSLSAGSEIRTW